MGYYGVRNEITRNYDFVAQGNKITVCEQIFIRLDHCVHGVCVNTRIYHKHQALEREKLRGEKPVLIFLI